jgi:hypothetical protein
MSNQQTQNIIRLFGMSTLQIHSSIHSIEKSKGIKLTKTSEDLHINKKQYSNFDNDIKMKAHKMSQYYEVFYCLENSIRTIIREILNKKYGNDWWENGIDERIKQDVAERIKRDQDSGFTLRSGDFLDFANFGELSNIIEKQWELFDDLFTSKVAMKKVTSSLNTLRGPIAHCCELAEDEVIRLEIVIKDWFRLIS